MEFVSTLNVSLWFNGASSQSCFYTFPSEINQWAERHSDPESHCSSTVKCILPEYVFLCVSCVVILIWNSPLYGWVEFLMSSPFTSGAVSRNCTAGGWSRPFPPYHIACSVDDDIPEVRVAGQGRHRGQTGEWETLERGCKGQGEELETGAEAAGRRRQPTERETTLCCSFSSQQKQSKTLT